MLLGFFLVISIVGFIVLSFRILRDRGDIKTITEEIKSKAEVKSIVDDEATKTVKPDSKLSKFDMYWNYIKLSLLDINMAALKRANSDSIGYIEVKGTEFSYPVVQKDNEFYKNHSFKKTENMFGWVYLDANQSVDNPSQNTIIYGNKVWFGILFDNLKELFKDEWKSNSENYIIKYTTNHSAGLYQIISVYETKDNDHIKQEFANEEDVKEFIKKRVSSSEIKFKASALPTDSFLTLTTNSKGSNIVVFAKMIKYRETK